MQKRRVNHMNMAISKAFEQVLHFDYLVIPPNLKYAVGLDGPFMVSIFLDAKHISIGLRNTENGDELGQVVYNRSLAVSSWSGYNTVLYEVEEVVKTLRYLQEIGCINIDAI